MLKTYSLINFFSLYIVFLHRKENKISYEFLVGWILGE